MIDKNVVKTLVDKWLEDNSEKGYFLVDIQVDDDNKIVVEIDHKDGVVIDDCVSLSEFINDNLDRDKEDYELEVGSAGLTSPLKVKAQYVKNIGNDVEVLTTQGAKLKGMLSEVGDDTFTIKVAKKVKPEGAKRPVIVEEDVTIKYSETKYTKYLIQFK